MPANTNICDSNFGNLCTANLDHWWGIEVNNMDSFWGCVCHWLNNCIVLWLFEHFVVKQIKLTAITTNYLILKWWLAQLTLQVFPDVRVNNRSLFAMSFTLQPLFNATQTNVLHRPCTLTGLNQLMFRQFFFGKTNPTSVLFTVINLQSWVLWLYNDSCWTN